MTALINKHAQRREDLFGFGLILLCTLQQILGASPVKISTNICYNIFILIIEGQIQQGKLFLSLFLHFAASCLRKENKKEKQLAVLATAGNRQHIRSPRARVLMGEGGAVLGMQVAADGPCSCRVWEPHPTQSSPWPCLQHASQNLLFSFSFLSFPAVHSLLFFLFFLLCCGQVLLLALGCSLASNWL